MTARSSPNPAAIPRSSSALDLGFAFPSKGHTSSRSSSSSRRPQLDRGGSALDITSSASSLHRFQQLQQPQQQQHHHHHLQYSNNASTISLSSSQLAGTTTNSSAILREPTTKCIEFPIKFLTTWYAHPAVPEFLICSRCQYDHIADSPFRDIFQLSPLSIEFQSNTTTTGGVDEEQDPQQCRFSKPRALELFRTARSTGDLEPLLEWMSTRIGIADCVATSVQAGQSGEIRQTAAGTDAKATPDYCIPSNGDLPEMKVCEACFEDILSATEFADTFSLEEEVAASLGRQVGEINARTCPSTGGGCAMALPYIRHACLEYGHIGDWAGFVEQASARLIAPACPKAKAVPMRGKRFFKPTDGPDGLVVCQGCFSDYFSSMDDWSKMTEMPYQAKALKCSLAEPNIQTAVRQAHRMDNMESFWSAMEIWARFPRCKSVEIPASRAGTWFTLNSDPTNFRICGGCHAAILGTAGAKEFFKAKPAPAPGTRQSGITSQLCCFNAAHPRAEQYLAKLEEAFLRAEIEPLTKYAHTFGALRPCPRSDNGEGSEDTNRRWYGWRESPEGSLLVCEECYASAVRGSTLEAHLQLRGERLPGPQACELYSRRMRTEWREACERGDDVGGLLNKAAERRQMFQQTVVVAREIMAMERRMGRGVKGSSRGPVDPAKAEQMQELEERWKEYE